MKNILFILAIALMFTVPALAQEDIEQLQQQPQPVTERQVELDAKKAAEQQKPKELMQNKPVIKNTDTERKKDTISKKRASRKPGKQ